MKEFLLGPSKIDLEKFDRVLRANIDCYINIESGTVKFSRDISTDELQITQVSEKLCQIAYQETML